jgi:tetratricopeptide (TPR) repeat protein
VVAVPDSGARAAALDSGAMRLVTAEVARLGDSVTIRVVATALPTGRRDGEAVATRAATDPALPAVVGYLTAAAMAQAMFASTPARAAAPRVRHVGALQAFDRAHIALGHWDLAAARDAFVEARRTDSTFAAADLWLAQLEVWQAPSRAPSPDATERLRLAARRAVRDSLRLTPRERALAQGLLALGEGRYPAACQAFDRVAARDSLDAEALFGAGECRRRDNLVVLRSRVPVFRASYHRAIRAYAAALRADPLVARTFGGTALWRLPAVLMADAATVRGGADSAGGRYAAVPSWRGDTMAFVPVPMAAFVRGEIGGPFAWTALARERANAVLADIARGWVRAAPGDADAHEVLAWSLETAGVLADAAGGASADSELRAAATSARDPGRQIRVGVSQVRVMLKRGEWANAGALADSLLRTHAEAAGEDAELLAPVAVLAGRPVEAARLLERAGPRVMLGRPDRERQAYARALAFLSAGEPRDSVLQWAARASALVTQPAALTTLCVAAQVAFGTVGTTALHDQAACTGMRHLQAQRALAAGDVGMARSRLRDIVGSRPVGQGAALTPDVAAAEAALALRLEGGPSARRQAELILGQLDRQGATFLAQPMLSGGLLVLLRLVASIDGGRREAAEQALQSLARSSRS